MNLGSALDHVYCAFCRNPRRLYRKKRAGFFNLVQAFGLSFMASLIFWHGWNAKALVICLVIYMVIDTFIILRSRVELPCPHCGFDPVLYLKNRDAACAKVKDFLKARQEDPDVWLARKPPIVLPKRPKNKKTTREIVV